MDKQKVFNESASHLLKQGRKAMNSNRRCKYRTEDGLMCAIGCLIPKELYSPEIEGTDAKALFGYATNWSVDPKYSTPLRAYFEVSSVEDIKILTELQDIHDECDVNSWAFMLKELAKKHNLNTDCLYLPGQVL